MYLEGVRQIRSILLSIKWKSLMQKEETLNINVFEYKFFRK